MIVEFCCLFIGFCSAFHNTPLCVDQVHGQIYGVNKMEWEICKPKSLSRIKYRLSPCSNHYITSGLSAGGLSPIHDHAVRIFDRSPIGMRHRNVHVLSESAVQLGV